MKKCLKISSILFCLLFSITLVSCGNIKEKINITSKEENMKTFEDTEVVVANNEIKELLEKATKNINNAKFTPIVYTEKQISTGTNYAILCKKTPDILDGASIYAMLILHKNLQNEVKILNIYNSNLQVEVIDKKEKGFVGGWILADTIVVNERAKKTLEKANAKLNIDTQYTPVVFLASQLVSGTNYSILCKRIDKINGNTYQILHIYENLQGNAEITGLYDFFEEQL